MPRTVYKDDDHEIDIEMSRWAGGYGRNKTADYAVQPFSSHVQTGLHWREPTSAQHTYHQFDWSPSRVAFESGTVSADGNASTGVIRTWTFTDASRIPAAEGMLARINFWLFRGLTNLTAGSSVEAVLRSFEHVPS